jgi:ABC-type Fe3+ transport system substrate-binding protein
MFIKSSRSGAGRLSSLCAAVVLSVAGSAAFAQDILTSRAENREQLLLEGARKEGQVVIYSAAIVNQALRPMAEAFMKKYPFIKLTYWRAESSGIFTKLSAEARAGKVMADVVEGTGVGESVIQAGLAQPYATPALADIPAAYHDPNNLWTPTRRSFFGAAYNTRLTPLVEAPKTYEDLLDPRWKGRLAWHAGSASGADLFVTNLRKNWGDERTRDYLRKLADQKVAGLSGSSARGLVDRVIAGEVGLGLNIFAHHPLISQAKGAPTSSILMNPVASTVGTMIVPKGIRHPHAAMLLVDFILSREGQTILAGAGYFPTHRDVATRADIAPITDALARLTENFISPEDLVKYTATSEEMLSATMGK